jgi:hypothetical protein
VLTCSRLLPLIAAPVLLVMGIITHLQPSQLRVVLGKFAFLGSMWMMYAMMSAFKVRGTGAPTLDQDG